MKAIIRYQNTANPLGFPLNHPAETRDMQINEVLVPPWEAISEVDLATLMAQNSAAVTAAIQAADLAVDTNQRNKLKNLKDLFDAGDVLEARWAAGTATNQEQKDLGRISYQINRMLKQLTLDNFRS